MCSHPECSCAHIRASVVISSSYIVVELLGNVWLPYLCFCQRCEKRNLFSPTSVLKSRRGASPKRLLYTQTSRWGQDGVRRPQVLPYPRAAIKQWSTAFIDWQDRQTANQQSKSVVTLLILSSNKSKTYVAQKILCVYLNYLDLDGPEGRSRTLSVYLCVGIKRLGTSAGHILPKWHMWPVLNRTNRKLVWLHLVSDVFEVKLLWRMVKISVDQHQRWDAFKSS